MNVTPVLVLDNGASTIKTNVVPETGSSEPHIITNAIIRQSKGTKQTFFGHEFDSCDDFASLHYRLPFERGFLTDWDAQKAIWDGILSKDVLNVNPPDFSLLITEPYFNLPNIQEQYDQFVFEEYEFQSYFRTTPAALIPYGSVFANDVGSPPECLMIVDSGYSFTHAIPLLNGRVVWKGVRRIDVGGKFLTNYLKELLSYRQYDMMGETYVTNDIKEKCCYISNDYKRDMELYRSEPNQIIQEYVLPNFSERREGRIKGRDEILTDEEDVVRMGNERFAVPELLFRPSDIGLSQTGLSGTIANSIASLPEDIQGLFWANIVLIGGNVKYAGFRERLFSELRSLAPVDYEVNVYEPENPIIEAYYSGAAFASQEEYASRCVTRAEYQEFGSNVCRKKFAGVAWQAREEEDIPVEEEKIRERSRTKGKAAARSKNIEDEAESGRKTGRGSRAARAASTK